MTARTTQQRTPAGSAADLAMAALLLMRPRQWVKNAFVFAPLFFTPTAMSVDAMQAVLLVFVCFCCVSSGVYCLNDVRDRDSDKIHPKKRLRPVASGRISVAAAVALAGVLIASGFAIALTLAPAALPALLLYLIVNIAYNIILKNIAIIDVLVISFGFVLRVYGGAEIIGVVPTPWIQICAGLLALFIALAKRRDDVVLDIGTEHRVSLSGYTRLFLDVCIGVTLAALLVSYMIFTLMDDAMARLGSDRLFMTVPFVIAGIFRYLQLTLVFERSGSPTDLVLKDWFLMAAVAGWLVVYAYLIYA
ncbi:MAG: decaprenyl-phosphate phosphoribosyltransferase [Alphaproteobacteria bacterium]|nr:decaprenyl-phosphate phosphoribosyltransferase [Alphaproteobacteria bacterium]